MGAHVPMAGEKIWQVFCGGIILHRLHKQQIFLFYVKEDMKDEITITKEEMTNEITITKEDLQIFMDDVDKGVEWSDTSYRICKFLGIDPTDGV
jgi:DNA-binding Xre family transcriptional regulator